MRLTSARLSTTDQEEECAMNTGETEQPTVPENSWAGAQLPSPVQPGTAPGQIAWPQENGLPTAPLGKIRGTGACIALTFVTFGIYPIVWYYMIHDEMKRHSGDGLGGGLALVLAIF